jgi:putative ABC transport system permease protein
VPSASIRQFAAPRWRKTLRDLTASKGRSLLVVAAIAVGVFAIGSVLASYSILTREMDASYLATNPASAVLTLDEVSDELVAAVIQRPEFETAEARRELSLRIDNGDGELRDMRLIVVRNFDAIRVARVTSEDGAWPPASDEILIERAALIEVGVRTGDRVTLVAAEGGTATFTVAGTAYDPGQTPAWIEGRGLGYVTPAGLARLGLAPTLDQLLVVATDSRASIEQLRLLARDLATDLEAQGISVRQVDVPTPGEHPNSEVMGTLLFLLGAFGVLALVLSALLVSTVVAALVGRELQQIAIMKTIGGRTRQIAAIYLAGVVALGAVALVVGLPLGIMAGRTYASFIAGRLNFDIASYRVDYWVYLLQIAAALLVPALAALLPVLRGSRITVHDGLDEIPAADATASPAAIRLLARLGGLPRPVLLGLRNAVRRQGRLALTVLSLAFGGAVFMVALNVGAGWNRTIDTEFDSRGFDVQLQLTPSEDTPTLSASDLPGAATLELWRSTEATLSDDSSVDGPPLVLLAPPAGSSMARYPLIEGRRLLPGDTNAIVINHGLVETRPDTAVGSALTANIGGRDASFEVVGIVRQIADRGIGYVSSTRLDELATATTLVLVDAAFEVGSLDELARSAERALAVEGFELAAASAADDERQVYDDHWILIVGMLMAMAVLVAAVGGIGMASTMSLNVIERRREIGVMRAVGAGTWTVLQVVLVEGLLVGALSWLVAVALSVPLTLLVGNVIGNLLIQTPLELSLSPAAIAIWLAIVTVVASIASAIPALEASELPVHQVLAYE